MKRIWVLVLLMVTILCPDIHAWEEYSCGESLIFIEIEPNQKVATTGTFRPIHGKNKKYLRRDTEIYYSPPYSSDLSERDLPWDTPYIRCCVSANHEQPMHSLQKSKENIYLQRRVNTEWITVASSSFDSASYMFADIFFTKEKGNKDLILDADYRFLLTHKGELSVHLTLNTNQDGALLAQGNDFERVYLAETIVSEGS